MVSLLLALIGRSDEDNLKYLVHIGANGIVEVTKEDDETSQ